MTELSLLARDVGVDERTLRRAVNQKTLRGERPTPRRLRISLAERAYIRRAWPLLAALRAALRTEKNVSFAMLFGSTAEGTDRPDSDIDLLVGLRDPGLERVTDLTERLTGATGRRVDLLRIEDAEADPALLAAIVGGGRVLVDREDIAGALSRRAAKIARQTRGKQSLRAREAVAGVEQFMKSRSG